VSSTGSRGVLCVVNCGVDRAIASIFRLIARSSNRELQKASQQVSGADLQGLLAAFELGYIAAHLGRYAD
jgi:hypothetical protein